MQKTNCSFMGRLKQEAALKSSVLPTLGDQPGRADAGYAEGPGNFMVIFLLKSFQRVSWDVNWDQDPFLIHLTFKQVQLLVHERPGIVVGDDQFFVNCPRSFFSGFSRTREKMKKSFRYNSQAKGQLL